MDRVPARRDFLHALAVTGATGLAGCISTASNNTDNSSTDTPSETTSDSTQGYTEASELSPPDSLEEWLADANGYDGERVRTGIGGEAKVLLGYDHDDGLGFAPVVIEVTPQTKVQWNWTDRGGRQNVVALDGTFDSGRPNAQSGTSYHHVFEEAGTYPFISEPGREDGWKGAVVVKEPPSTGYEAVDRWLFVSDNFDGTVTDRTDQDITSVTVGAEGNNGHFAFDPPVLKISPDTTVRWEWTDADVPANVVFKDIDVRSGAPSTDSETTFRYTFSDPGTYRYSSLPHKMLGMRGAIIVSE